MPKPDRVATCQPAGRSPRAGNSRARITRCSVSHWCGVVPVSATKRRAKVRGDIAARRAVADQVWLLRPLEHVGQDRAGTVGARDRHGAVDELLLATIPVGGDDRTVGPRRPRRASAPAPPDEITRAIASGAPIACGAWRRGHRQHRRPRSIESSLAAREAAGQVVAAPEVCRGPGPTPQVRRRPADSPQTLGDLGR